MGISISGGWNELHFPLHVRGHSYQSHKEFGDAIHELSIRKTWRLGSGITCHHRGDLPMVLSILAVQEKDILQSLKPIPLKPALTYKLRRIGSLRCSV